MFMKEIKVYTRLRFEKLLEDRDTVTDNWHSVNKTKETRRVFSSRQSVRQPPEHQN